MCNKIRCLQMVGSVKYPLNTLTSGLKCGLCAALLPKSYRGDVDQMDVTHVDSCITALSFGNLPLL